MAILRSMIDKFVTRVIGRDEYESRALRRYFERQHDIRIGLYSIGAFDRWRVPPGTVIGRYCSISRTARLIAGNHPMEGLSTHPYFYLKQYGMVDSDLAHRRPQIIEDDVWLGDNCIITPGCHRVGRGAVIGAGAVVMSDVPPYAVMAGAPARFIRFRFPQETIDALEASQWWILDSRDLRTALAKAPTLARHPTPDAVRTFLAAIGKADNLPAPLAAAAAPAVGTTIDAAKAEDLVVALLRREMPEFSSKDMERPFQDLKIDSFGLINLRLGLESSLGSQIPDRAWGTVARPSDLTALASGREVKTVAAPVAGEPAARADSAPQGAIEARHSARAAGERRIQPINMPQMAISGLSEAWLFKETGDIHWSVLTKGLRTPSSAVCDSEGDRLYATFTRIRYSLEAPLTNFRENEILTIDLEMTRFGAGMFFSSVALTAPNATGQAQLMTTFSKFGEAGAAASLLKGQPVLPQDCEIQPIEELPEFVHEYRALRAATLVPPLFETEYEIVPPHDINGVGLLYFAAYPIITDVCALRYAGLRLASEFSTTFRDVCYFANSTPDEILLFRVHRWDETPTSIAFDATISRKSDGKVMAWVTTEKRRIAPETPAVAGAADQQKVVSEVAAT